MTDPVGAAIAVFTGPLDVVATLLGVLKVKSIIHYCFFPVLLYGIPR